MVQFPVRPNRHFNHHQRGICFRCLVFFAPGQAEGCPGSAGPRLERFNHFGSRRGNEAELRPEGPPPHGRVAQRTGPRVSHPQRFRRPQEQTIFRRCSMGRVCCGWDSRAPASLKTIEATCRNEAELSLAGTMQLKRHSTTDEPRWTRMKNLFPTALWEEPSRASSAGPRPANLTLKIRVDPCPSVVLNRIVPAAAVQ